MNHRFNVRQHLRHTFTSLMLRRESAHFGANRCANTKSLEMLDTWRQDLRFGTRSIFLNPDFILALGSEELIQLVMRVCAVRWLERRAARVQSQFPSRPRRDPGGFRSIPSRRDKPVRKKFP